MVYLTGFFFLIVAGVGFDFLFRFLLFFCFERAKGRGNLKLGGWGGGKIGEDLREEDEYDRNVKKLK